MHELHQPIKFMDKFLQKSDWKATTVFDTLTGNIQHLNLKEVVSFQLEVEHGFKLEH